MSTPYFDGKEIKEVELLDLFPSDEGMITQYYGRIGSGKTYAATSDVLDLLRRGKVVYVNWKIKYSGFDERSHILYNIIGLFGKKRFFSFPKENLIYFELSDKWARDNGYEDFVSWLSSRTDCIIFADEGHLMFDSYAGIKMSIDKRAAIYHTRHFNRSINIVSQRPTSIHVSMRANVNMFYKCEKIWSFAGFVRFKRSEFQDMTAENVDDREENLLGVKWYWGKNSVFSAYDTHYMRGSMEKSQKIMYKAYDYNYLSRCVLLFRNLAGLVYNKGDVSSIKANGAKKHTPFWRKKAIAPPGRAEKAIVEIKKPRKEVVSLLEKYGSILPILTKQGKKDTPAKTV